MNRNLTPPLRHTLDPLALLRDLWREREVIAQLTRHDVEATFRGSILGALWLLIQPLISLAVYAFVFTQVFTPRASVSEEHRFDFVLSLFAGMILYNVFAEVLSRAPLLVLGKASYVKNVVFPLEVLPITTLGTAFVGLFSGLLILLVAILVTRGGLPLSILWLPITLLPLVFLTLGLAWILSSLGVFLRDVQPTVQVILQMLFFATPILYSIEAVPPTWRPLISLNPLAAIVSNARGTLLLGSAPDWSSYAVSIVISLVIFCAGYTWFARTRKGFADVM